MIKYAEDKQETRNNGRKKGEMMCYQETRT